MQAPSLMALLHVSRAGAVVRSNGVGIARCFYSRASAARQAAFLPPSTAVAAVAYRRPAFALGGLVRPVSHLLLPPKRPHGTSSHHNQHRQHDAYSHHIHDDDHHHHHAGLIDRSSAEGTRITLLGLASNIALAAAKAVGGVLWGSASLIADAVHSLSDLVSDIVTLVAYRKARTARDKAFPYGYGKWEPLGSLTISGLLMSAGLGTAYHSFEMLRALMVSTGTAARDAAEAAVAEAAPVAYGYFGDLSAYSLDNPQVAVIAVGLAAGSVVVKEVLFWATMRVARRMKSDVLVANAWHHRADSASGLVALAGVGGALVGLPALDPIGGLLVSGLIVQASVTTIMPAIRDLLDLAPKGLNERVEVILRELKEKDRNIQGFHSVRTRKMGPDILIDFQLQVNPKISVSLSHQITENARHAIHDKISGVSEVLIHVDVEEHDHGVTPSPTTVPTSSIESEIATAALTGMNDIVRQISHLKVHYLKGGIEVDAEILLVSEDIPLRDAIAIANRVQANILRYPGVTAADVHLETSEHEAVQTAQI